MACRKSYITHFKGCPNWNIYFSPLLFPFQGLICSPPHRSSSDAISFVLYFYFRILQLLFICRWSSRLVWWRRQWDIWFLSWRRRGRRWWHYQAQLRRWSVSTFSLLFQFHTDISREREMSFYRRSMGKCLNKEHDRLIIQ